MPMNNRDASSLWDMIQAIQEIQEDTTGFSYDDFLNNRTVRRAVERNFEILGEAARRLPEDFRALHAEIDWRSLIGLRNILAHQYDSVREEILWEIITIMLPLLLMQLENLLPPLPG